MGVDWFRVQPQPGPFTWAYIDDQVARLAARHIQAFPTLAGTPRWVLDEPSNTPPLASKSARSAWREFVTAVVRRYGHRGTFWKPNPQGGASPFHVQCGCDARPVPIKAWQVWNEPNLHHYFSPKPSPRKYATLVKLSRRAIKAADSKAKLILGGLSAGAQPDKDIGAVPYLKRLYRIRGMKASFDGAALHPYAKTADDMRISISRFSRVMRQHGDRRTPLWITEIGWGSKHPDHFGLNKGIPGQNRILGKALKLIANRRKEWGVRHVYWFFWRDPPDSLTGRQACSFCRSAGLLRKNRRPKPAYRTFRRLAKQAG
jgi:hypothetical protein